jgi:hypothetical protein
VNRRLEIASRSPIGMTGASDAASDAASSRRGSAAALTVTVDDGWFNGMRVRITCAPTVPAAAARSARIDGLVAAAAPSAEERISEAIARFDARLPTRIRPGLVTGNPSSSTSCATGFARSYSAPATAVGGLGSRAAGGQFVGGDDARRSTPTGPAAAAAPGQVAATAEAEPLCQTPSATTAARVGLLSRGRAMRRRQPGDGFLIPLEALGPIGAGGVR